MKRTLPVAGGGRPSYYQRWEFGSKKSVQANLIKRTLGAPWQLSRLRIWHCHCCGMGLIPGLGTSTWAQPERQRQQQQNKQRNSLLSSSYFYTTTTCSPNPFVLATLHKIVWLLFVCLFVFIFVFCLKSIRVSCSGCLLWPFIFLFRLPCTCKNSIIFACFSPLNLSLSG